MTPPSPAITVRIVGATDVGLIREHNEDNYTVLNVETGEVDFSQGRELPLPMGGALLVVCDGMGGAAAGEVASQMAVEVLRRELGPKIAATSSQSGKIPESGKVEAAAAAKSADLPAGGDKTDSAAKATAASDPSKSQAITTEGPAVPDSSDAGRDDAKSEAATAEKPSTGDAAKEAKEPPAEAGDAARQAAKSAPASPAVPAAMQAQVQPVSGEASGPISEAQLHGLARKLRQAGQRANQEIYEAACADISKAGMGTTLTCLILVRSHVIVGQVGDSRAYLCRKGRLTQITHDQSLVNQLLESGQITPEQAKLFEHSNVILQALGVQEDVEVVLSTETVRRGDRLMLCSDGLVGVVSDETIQEVMSNSEHIEEAVRRLIELAREGGGPDNITVIVAEVGGEAVPVAAETELAEYRVLYLDGEKAPDRRMWGSEYAFMSQSPSARDAAAGGAAAQPVSSRLSVVSMAAVLALLILGVIGGLLYFPVRPPIPTAGPVLNSPPTLPANPLSPAANVGVGGVGPALPPPANALDGGQVPSVATLHGDAGLGTAVPAATAAAVGTPPPSAQDAGASDSAVAVAREPEDDKGTGEAADPDEAAKHKKKRKKKKAADETPDEPVAPVAPAVPPTTTPVTPPAPTAPPPESGDKPTAPAAPEKPPVAATPEKPVAASEKPVEKPVPAAEKSAPAPDKPTPPTANP